MAAMQNGRILRFLMVIGIVVLTIFIYASYYSNPVMTIPTHMHLSAALVSTPYNTQHTYPSNNNTNTNSNVILVNSNNVNTRNSPSSDADDGGASVSSSSSSSSGDVTNGSSPAARNEKILQKNSFDHDTNSSLTSDATNIQPTVNNIQRIIGRADTILRNLTSSINGNSSTSSYATANESRQNTSAAQHQPALSLAAAAAAAAAPQPPSALLAKVNAKISRPVAAAAAAPFDPSKGIPTANIYESGHLDVNPQLCPDEGESIRLAIIITSAPTHAEARLAIRQTWGHYGARRDVAIAFILGRTENASVEEALNNENYMYGDLIRGHFIDSYNNLTLKTISTLEWVDQNCPQTDFVLKTDDDMFINIPKLLAFADKHSADKRIIFGRLAKKWKPIRNKKSKYYVAPSQFAATVFPQFTTGPAYLLSADIVHELYEKALEQTYLKLEDVFTTGIVAQQLNIKRVHVNEFLNRRIAFNPCNIRKAISVHMIKSNEQFDLWKKLLDQTKCK